MVPRVEQSFIKKNILKETGVNVKKVYKLSQVMENFGCYWCLEPPIMSRTCVFLAIRKIS